MPERPNMWYIFEKRIVQGFEKLYSQVSNAQVQNTQIHKYKFYCFRIYIYIWHIWHTLLLVNCSIDKFHNLTVQAMSLRLNRLNRLNRLLHCPTKVYFLYYGGEISFMSNGRDHLLYVNCQLICLYVHRFSGEKYPGSEKMLAWIFITDKL